MYTPSSALTGNTNNPHFHKRAFRSSHFPLLIGASVSFSIVVLLSIIILYLWRLYRREHTARRTETATAKLASHFSSGRQCEVQDPFADPEPVMLVARPVAAYRRWVQNLGFASDPFSDQHAIIGTARVVPPTQDTGEGIELSGKHYDGLGGTWWAPVASSSSSSSSSSSPSPQPRSGSPSSRYPPSRRSSSSSAAPSFSLSYNTDDDTHFPIPTLPERNPSRTSKLTTDDDTTADISSRNLNLHTLPSTSFPQQRTTRIEPQSQIPAARQLRPCSARSQPLSQRSRRERQGRRNERKGSQRGGSSSVNSLHIKNSPFSSAAAAAANGEEEGRGLRYMFRE